ncbi:MAG TPA: transcriptional repressor LexA [Opitutaceae bacterium]|nr:transcriptional repressor LexA [Opitutaceae bacterium]
MSSMLTERQQAVVDFIRAHQLEHSIPPSTREIQRQFGFASQNSVRCHLKALAAKGQVSQLVDGSWGVTAREVQGHLFHVPVFGAIPAGIPTQQEQLAEETLAIDPAFFGVPRARCGDLWALRVQGDSMVGAHILDGDIVALVRRAPRPGEIIAALVDGTTSTLKRLVQVRGRPVLRAENERYPDIIPERLECQGVVVGVLRRSVS